MIRLARVRRLGESKAQVRINFVLALLWAVATPVAVWRGWIYAVAFISVVTLYDTVAAHWAAATGAQDRALIERLDRIEELVRDRSV